MDEQQPDGVYRFDHSLTAQADRLRKEAREAPPGVKRDQLLKRAAQLEDDVRMKAMVRPPPAEITST